MIKHYPNQTTKHLTCLYVAENFDLETHTMFCIAMTQILTPDPKTIPKHSINFVYISQQLPHKIFKQGTYLKRQGTSKDIL